MMDYIVRMCEVMTVILLVHVIGFAGVIAWEVLS